MIRKGGHHMIFPDSYSRDQYSPAEEARQEAEQAAAENLPTWRCLDCGGEFRSEPGPAHPTDQPGRWCSGRIVVDIAHIVCYAEGAKNRSSRPRRAT